MEINPGKNPDLGEKSDYPTAGWLNQTHDLLQGMGLEKIDPAEKQSDYATDADLISGGNQSRVSGDG